ncbi:4a-hydroxytetrahydrobiopterin dehydratase [bacterium]|nr:4a-hydroxytetrahydrobiopterin dehydratase [bacterium]
MEKLTGARRQAALKELHGWVEVLERDAIRKTFHFSDFSNAFAFMTQVALLPEKWDHHPEWFNDEGRVEIILFSRDVEGVSGRDVEMAHRIDQLAPAHDK